MEGIGTEAEVVGTAASAQRSSGEPLKPVADGAPSGSGYRANDSVPCELATGTRISVRAPEAVAVNFVPMLNVDLPGVPPAT
jgi:hypothetical protein